MTVMTMLNQHDLKQSLLILVLEKDNFERMKKADPMTLESAFMGGLMPPIQYPDGFSLLLAYEEDDAELYRLAKSAGTHSGLRDLIAYLERGRKFIKGLDGKQEAITLVKGSDNG